jgi:Ran GTPase-activating protein (RanGAP) involved in mRNA processing and transport
MKNVITLDYSHKVLNTNQTIDLIDSLRGQKNIEKIDLSYNKIYKRATVTIAKYMNVNSDIINLNINNNYIGNGIENILKEINHNDNFKVLKAQNNSIEHIPEIRSQVGLVYLDLSSNKLSHVSIKNISEFIKKNKTIRYLKLNSISENTRSLALIFDAIDQNSSLTHIELSNNKIDQNCILSLSRALKKNGTLSYINISNCGINDISVLTEALNNHNKLECLILKDNCIGNDGAIDFSRSLIKNLSLLQLDLSDNNIYNSGAISLAISLIVNTTLKYLNLSKNNISDKGVIELVKSCDNLDLLDLTNNSMGKRGSQCLINARKRTLNRHLLETITVMPVELIDMILHYTTEEREIDDNLCVVNIKNLKY